MNVLIFGLGNHKGGYSAALYYLQKGDSVRVTDLREEESLGPDVQQLRELGASFTLGRHEINDVQWADLVIKNPAILSDSPYLTAAKDISNDIIELCRRVRSIPTIHLIGITGTKGKSSATHQIYHHLLHQGKSAYICGNIGISAFTILSKLEKQNSEQIYIVIELSSWQIHDLHQYIHDLPRFEALILTSLYPDHQDRYPSIESYYEDKMRLFLCCSHHYYLSTQSVDTLKTHNLPFPKENAIIEHPDSLVKSVLVDMDIDSSSIDSISNLIPPLSHRNALISTTEKIRWIDDSAATIPQATAHSIGMLSTPYILICGGSEKHSDLLGLKLPLMDAEHLILIDGTFTQERLVPYLDINHIEYSGPFRKMSEIVRTAYDKAIEINKEITIILSPAAASFGVFRSSDERGDTFINEVHQLSSVVQYC